METKIGRTKLVGTPEQLEIWTAKAAKLPKGSRRSRVTRLARVGQAALEAPEAPAKKSASVILWVWYVSEGGELCKVALGPETRQTVDRWEADLRHSTAVRFSRTDARDAAKVVTLPSQVYLLPTEQPIEWKEAA